jgi:L-lysine 2,3-aminomutase
MKFYGLRDLDNIPQLQVLTDDQRFAIKVVSSVLPFRVNNYVIEELIDWSNVPEDPIFQLTFMQKDMLSNDQFRRMSFALSNNHTLDEIQTTADDIRLELNPHPAGQMTLNVPLMFDEPVKGVQHKYRETVLRADKHAIHIVHSALDGRNSLEIMTLSSQPMSRKDFRIT